GEKVTLEAKLEEKALPYYDINVENQLLLVWFIV
ncbi:unnamed protein product, partial [marine sediment metagenome]